MEDYDVDDRGNIAQFYELDGDWGIVGELDREAGPAGDVDSVTTWWGNATVTQWARENGYADEIDSAKKVKINGRIKS